MPIRFSCPACRAPVNAPDEAAGGKARCPRCRAEPTVPLRLAPEGQMKKALLFACVVLLLASQATSRADVIINVQQVGGDVVATGSGSIDTTDLMFIGNTSNAALVWAGFPLGSFAVVGGTTLVSEDVYNGITGPSSFGSGGQFFATSGSGDVFGVVADNVLDLPSGYISGSPLLAT